MRTDGACCWYCFRVWNVAFSASMTLIEFKAGLRKVGEEADTLNDQLTKYTAWLVAKVVEYTEACGGSREGMRLASWPAKEELSRLSLFVIEWQAPEEHCMEHAEYLRKHGDPAVNGRGDKIARGTQGQKLVQMKVDAMWVKRKKWINQVQKQQCLVDSSDDLANEMVHCQCEALGGTSDSACAYGSGVASGSVRQRGWRRRQHARRVSQGQQ